MPVSLREVTEGNLKEVLDLSVSDDQKEMVAPNVYSLAQAAVVPEAWFRAIYAEEKPVGFLMLSDDRTQPRYYLWRFMIDEKHQGKGYGTAAMGLLADYVRTLPDADRMYVSWVPAPGGPEPFYRRLGFVETGWVHGGEIEAVWEL